MLKRLWSRYYLNKSVNHGLTRQPTPSGWPEQSQYLLLTNRLLTIKLHYLQLLNPIIGQNTPVDLRDYLTKNYIAGLLFFFQRYLWGPIFEILVRTLIYAFLCFHLNFNLLSNPKKLGPVVQSIVSLTSLLIGQLLQCFMTLYLNTLIFFVEKKNIGIFLGPVVQN